MSDIKKDGGPAFGGYVRHHKNVAGQEYFEDVPAMGMSLRDYFAAAALQGYLAVEEGAICRDDGTNFTHPITSAILAELSYQAADAMLAEREKP